MADDSTGGHDDDDVTGGHDDDNDDDSGGDGHFTDNRDSDGFGGFTPLVGRLAIPPSSLVYGHTTTAMHDMSTPPSPWARESCSPSETGPVDATGDGGDGGG